MTILSRLTLLIWLAFVGCITLFALFWRTGHWHPHAVWAILSLVLTLVPLTLLTFVTLVRMICGPARLRTLGWLFIGATPIVWFATYFASIYEAAATRKPLNLSPSLRITALWASSLMDAEARWRYPRWSPGQHTVLIDAGTPAEDAALMAAMDDHVKAMAKLLGQPVPKAEIAWVRGSLLGQSGRSVGAWSLCGPGSAELNYMDRHEVAHALIATLAGPDHDPPFVLVEGWAESQSRDRNSLVRHLAARQSEGTAMSLQDLLGPDWYSRSDGPVYFVGGPLAIFLMEQYTPQKFFSLYANARRVTFLEDCRVHLGESWDLVEDRFWKWLDEEANRPEVARQSHVELDPDVPPKHWNELLEQVRMARRRRRVRPSGVAFAIDETWSNGQRQTLRACFEKDDVWMCSGSDSEVNRFVLAREDRGVVLEPAMVGRNPAAVKLNGSSSETLIYATSCLREYLPIDSFEQLTPPNTLENQVTIRIIKVVPPPKHPQKLWQLNFERIVNGKLFCEGSIDIDPNCEYREVRQRTVQTDGSLWEMECKYESRGGVMLPTDKRTLSIYEGNEVTSEASLRLLSAEEVRKLHAEVEQAIDRLPAPRDWQRYALLVAIGTPLLGMLLLSFRSGGRRTRVGGPHDSLTV